MTMQTFHDASSLCLLCRGASLQAYRDFSHEHDDLIIVNNFEREMKMLGVQHFANKNMLHSVCREHTALMQRHTYRRFGIKHVLCNNFKDQGKHPNHSHITRMGLNIIYYDDNVYSNMPGDNANGFGYPTNGMQTLVYACQSLHPKEINVFGMDFYAADYFCGKKPGPIHHKKRDRMLSYLKKIFDHYDDIMFRFWSYHLVDHDKDNVRWNHIR